MEDMNLPLLVGIGIVLVYLWSTINILREYERGVLVVSPTLGPKNMKDLIAFVKAKPGQLNFASAGIGSATHMTGEQFKLEAGLELKHVPYKGTPEALTDTMQGRVQYFFAPIVPALPFVKDNRLLALAVTTKDRSPVLPNVPTVAEAGLPGYDVTTWYALVFPARTPAAVVEKTRAALAAALAREDVQKQMHNAAFLPSRSTPAELAAHMKSEISRWGTVRDKAGIK